MRRVRIFLVSALIATLATGCATSALTTWRRQIGHPGREIQGDNGALIGSYTGETDIRGRKYATILLLNPRVSCNDITQIKLLLPLVADNTSVPILREASQSDIVAGGKPVNMVPVDNLLYVNNFPTVLSKLPAWEGYPGTVLLDRNGPVDPFDVGRPLVLYRYGAEQDNVRVRAVTSELKWVCRSRSDRILTIIAYPFAIPLDIVSAPVVYVVYEVYINVKGSD